MTRVDTEAPPHPHGFCPNSSFLVTLGCAHWSDTKCLEGDPLDSPHRGIRANFMRVAMTVEGGTAIVLAYVLVSVGVIIAFLLAAFVIGMVHRSAARAPQAAQFLSP